MSSVKKNIISDNKNVSNKNKDTEKEQLIKIKSLKNKIIQNQSHIDTNPNYYQYNSIYNLLL